MRRTLAVAGVIFIFVTMAAFVVRVQPRDSARVTRRGSALTVATSRVAFGWPLGDSCIAPRRGDRLLFRQSFLSGDVRLNVNFSYEAPAAISPGWPAGDWCSSLDTFVGRHVLATATDPLAEPRTFEEKTSADLQRALATAGLRASSVSARLQLPPGWERTRPIAAVASLAVPSKPVIFLGLDGADWQLLDRYIEHGSMPNLARLLRQGTRGVLETEHPPLSPLVWTTMMTGVSPLEHGILDFTRFNPYTHEKEPITSDERRVPAIWNMLTYAGKQAAVFGLWATYAAEPVRRINVSDRLFTFLYTGTERPAGVVYPQERQQWAEDRVNDAERAIDLARMREYIPSLTEAEFAALSRTENPYANPPAALRRILVDTEIYRRISLESLKSRPSLPDLTIVYFEGTDTIGHEFAPFAPPKQPEVSQADFDRYNGVPEKYFQSVDAIIGEYAAVAATSGAVIVLASDHGFRWTEGRPTQISSTATATAAKWHRNEGIFAVSGPSASLRMPRGIRDVCGVLRALTGTPEVDYRPYFVRATPPPPPVSKRASDEQLAKLRALGYIGSNEPTRSALPQNDTRTDGAYNNAGLILRNEHRTGEAIASFERALSINPHYASAMWNLSETLYDAGRDLDRADRLLVASLQNGLADAPRFVVQRSIDYRRTSRGERSLRLLDAAVGVAPADAELRIFRGRYRIERRDCRGALDDFLAAERQQSNNALAFASAGLAQMCIGDSAAAQASFARARELDPTLALPR